MDGQKKCWMVVAGEYSYYRVLAVFTTEEAAEAWAAHRNANEDDTYDRVDVEEINLDPPPTEYVDQLHVKGIIVDGVRHDRGESIAHIIQALGADVCRVQGPYQRRYVGQPDHIAVEVMGTDHERVRKVYSEVMARTLADPTWWVAEKP